MKLIEIENQSLYYNFIVYTERYGNVNKLNNTTSMLRNKQYIINNE